MENLKPCPFCGGKAEVGTVEYSDKNIISLNEGQKKFYFVNCTKCGSQNQGIIGRKTEQDAREHWNIRNPDLTALEAENASLKAKVEEGMAFETNLERQRASMMMSERFPSLTHIVSDMAEELLNAEKDRDVAVLEMRKEDERIQALDFALTNLIQSVDAAQQMNIKGELLAAIECGRKALRCPKCNGKEEYYDPMLRDWKCDCDIKPSFLSNIINEKEII